MENLIEKPTIVIFGFGYTAQFLAQELTHLGFNVIGTTRDKNKVINQTQLNEVFIEFDSATLANHLRMATHILVTVPPVGTIGDPVLAAYSDAIKENASHIQWLGYLSSTSVYGDHLGAWVHEESACLPLDGAGALRLAAENAWQAFARNYGLPLHIFRLAGIYGPHRNALERIIAGKKFSIYKEGQYFSRIHVADIVAVLLASMQNPCAYSVYNVADDEPTAAHVIDAYAASLLQRPVLPLLPYEKATMSRMEQHFYSSNRRVVNTKIKAELNIRLRYPSYREGLESCLKSIISSPN